MWLSFIGLYCSSAMAQTGNEDSSASQNDISGTYRILEGSQFKFATVTSDHNVLRRSEKSNSHGKSLNQLWHISAKTHPAKGQFYQLQSLENGLFLTASMTRLNTNDAGTHVPNNANAGVTYEIDYDAQSFSIEKVSMAELLNYHPGLYARVSAANQFAAKGEPEHIPVKIKRFGYAPITDTNDLVILPDGNIATSSRRTSTEQTHHSTGQDERYFVLVNDSAKNPHRHYDLNNPRAIPHNKARALELQAGYRARALAKKNQAGNTKLARQPIHTPEH